MRQRAKLISCFPKYGGFLESLVLLKFLNGSKENGISHEQWDMYCIWIFFPLSGRWYQILELLKFCLVVYILGEALLIWTRKIPLENWKNLITVCLLITVNNMILRLKLVIGLPCVYVVLPSLERAREEQRKLSELSKIRWHRRNQEFWLSKKYSQLIFS